MIFSTIDKRLDRVARGIVSVSMNLHIWKPSTDRNGNPQRMKHLEECLNTLNRLNQRKPQ